jgi:hypothetical protein
MRISDFAQRLVLVVRDSLPNPWYYGTRYEGRYWAEEARIVGLVASVRGDFRRPPVSVSATCDDRTIATTRDIEVRGESWGFSLELGAPPDPRDILEDRIKVFAVDKLGTTSALRIDGTAQISHIREVYAH